MIPLFLQQEIQNASYGQDLSSVEQLYKEHQTKHDEIMNLREEVEKVCKKTVGVACHEMRVWCVEIKERALVNEAFATKRFIYSFSLLSRAKQKKGPN